MLVCCCQLHVCFYLAALISGLHHSQLTCSTWLSYRSMRKTRLLLDAVMNQGKSVTYFALDLMEQPLREALEDLAQIYHPAITFKGMVGTYDDGMLYIQQQMSASSSAASASSGADADTVSKVHAGADGSRKPYTEHRGFGLDQPGKLIMWLGSSIGNFSREEAAAFLSKLQETSMLAGAASCTVVVGVCN